MKPSKNGTAELHAEADEIDLNGPDQIKKVEKTITKQAAAYDRDDALMLVGFYYGLQKVRVAAGNKVYAHTSRRDQLSDETLINTLKENMEVVERQAWAGLKRYAEASPLGRWCMSNLGVGPVITAGLLAHIDLHIATTPGKIIRFGGLDPTLKWNKGEKRPYNAALKVLLWKLGESFKKVSNKPDSLYGRLYRERKLREETKNANGEFAEQAQERLAVAIKNRYRVSEEQKKIWASGKLQQVGVDRRACRYAVTIFLHHYHTVGRALLGYPPIRPWIFEFGGHVDVIPVPHWPMSE